MSAIPIWAMIGAIDIFYHGMDDALRMDLDRDFFNRHIEKPVGLDHLETLVHEGGGVNGDLFSHLPVWDGGGHL